jgi:hypothetical protein
MLYARSGPGERPNALIEDPGRVEKVGRQPESGQLGIGIDGDQGLEHETSLERPGMRHAQLVIVEDQCPKANDIEVNLTRAVTLT